MPKKSAFKKPEPQLPFAANAKDRPATQGMLQLVRTELKSEMRAGFSEMDARFNQMDSQMSLIHSKLERTQADVSRIALLVEEQNSNNRIVLEGLTGLWQRQGKVETRVEDVEKFVRSIGRVKS
ncbi:hypothetical protein WDW86_09160 [Bdellovibrionota bacterium FG-2]